MSAFEKKSTTKAVQMAFPRWFEHPTYRLGGGRSIQLSYGNIFKIYSIIGTNLLNVNRLYPKGGRYNIFLGGGPSIQFSYWDKFKIFNFQLRLAAELFSLRMCILYLSSSYAEHKHKSRIKKAKNR